MHLAVDSSQCQGHALCASIAPDLVLLDDVEGHATPAASEVPAALMEAASRAAAACPERAITLLD